MGVEAFQQPAATALGIDEQLARARRTSSSQARASAASARGLGQMHFAVCTCTLYHSMIASVPVQLD
jgi:hypothetical protein